MLVDYIFVYKLISFKYLKIVLPVRNIYAVD